MLLLLEGGWLWVIFVRTLCGRIVLRAARVRGLNRTLHFFTGLDSSSSRFQSRKVDILFPRPCSCAVFGVVRVSPFVRVCVLEPAGFARRRSRFLVLTICCSQLSQTLNISYSTTSPLLQLTMSSSASTQSTASTLSSNFTFKNATGSQRKVFLVVSPITTEESVRAVAAIYGPIQNVHIPKDQVTQRSRGIAFVAFGCHEHAVAAIQGLEGCGLDGVILHPRWANPKQKVATTAAANTTTRRATREKEAQATAERVEEKRAKRRQKRVQRVKCV